MIFLPPHTVSLSFGSTHIFVSIIVVIIIVATVTP